MSARSFTKAAFYTAGLAVWLVASFTIGQTIAALLVDWLGSSLNQSVQVTVMAALGYVFALLLAIGVPALIFRRKTDLSTLGAQRLPYWSDIGLSILSILPYYIVSGAVLYLGTEVFRVIDPSVGQDIPFKDLSMRIEYFVAFITLVVMAPLAEELLFRGYFLGKLKDRTGKWLAVLITAMVFGFMHLLGVSDKGDLVLQWGAAADTFSMGLVAGSLRVISGSIWAGMLLHAIKNAVAFYFLFINPLPPA